MNKLKVGDRVRYKSDGVEGLVVAIVEQKPMVIARPIYPVDHPNWPQRVPDSPVFESELEKVK